MHLDIGERASIDGVDKRWAGQNYGWQTQESYDELEQQGKLRWGVQWMDRFKQNVEIGAQQAYETTINESDRALIKQGAAGLKDGAIRFLNGNGLNSAVSGSLDYVKTSFENVVSGNGEGNGGLMKTAEMVAEASYDVPYDTAKSLGAPEGVAIAAGVAGSLLEPSPIGEAKAVTAASEFISKTGKYAEKVVDAAPPTTPTLQPATVGVVDGSLRFKAPEPTNDGVFKLTAGEKYRVPGRSRQGMADEYPETMESIQKAEKRNTPGYQPGERNFNEYISFSPEFKDKPLDPVAYHKFIRKHNFVENFQRLDIEQPAGKAFRKMEQHHLFPVGESGPFIERMRALAKKGIGDNDDVVNMFAYADYLGATMGHRWSNMLNMHQAPHKDVHRMYDVDTTALRKELSQINTVDELYERMHNHIIDRILPAKNMALDEQISYLKSNPKFEPRLLEEAQTLRDAFKSQISPKQLNAIDEYIEALKLRGA